MARYRYEIWNQTNTTRLAILSSVVSAEDRQVLQGERTLVLQAATDDPAIALAASGAVLRVHEVGTTNKSAWRLVEPMVARQPDGQQALAWTCDALWTDFRHGIVRQAQSDGRGLVAFSLIGLTAQEYLESYILPGYIGDGIAFALGTIDASIASERFDMAFERTSPLAAIRALEAALEAEVDFRLSTDGLTYYIDVLEQIGAAEGTAELRYRKNLPGVERRSDETEIQTRLHAYGANDMSLADATWRVSSYAAGVITFPTGEDNPVFADGAFVDLRFAIAGKGSWPITASSATARTVTITPGGTLPAANDVGYFTTDVAGTRLDYLEHPVGVAAHRRRLGIYETDVPDAINLVTNPTINFSGGFPASWNSIGTPTTTQELDRRFIRYGTSAARVVADAAGEGLLSAAFTVPTGDTLRPYLGIMAGLTVISGVVRFELRHSNGITYPIQEQPQNDGRDVYIELTAGPVHADPLPAGTAQLAIVAHGGPATFVFDAAMATPQIASEVPAFVDTNGARILWQEAAAELERRRVPKVEYSAIVADLYRVDPAAFPYDELNLGDTVRIRDPLAGNIDAQRIVELTLDYEQPSATRVTLASGPDGRITDATRPPRSSGRRIVRPRRSATLGPPSVLTHNSYIDPADGLAYISAVGSARVATLELYTKADPGDPWPGAPTDTVTGRSGTFLPGLAGAPFFYRIIPRDGAGGAGEAVEGTSGGNTVDPGPQDVLPVASIALVSSGATSQTMSFAGLLPPDGVGPLEYAVRAALEGAVTPGWPGWSTTPPSNTIYNRDPKRATVVEFKVRDQGTGIESAVATRVVSAQLTALRDDTGGIADSAAMPDGRTALQVTRQATSPSQNLVGTDASTQKTVGATGGVAWSIPVAAAGLAEGDVVSVSADVVALNGAELFRLDLRWYNALSGGSILRTDVGAAPFASGTWSRIRNENRAVPTGALRVDVFIEDQGANTQGAYGVRCMLNRGPLALPFQEPPFRAARETADAVQDGSTKSVTTIAERKGATGHVFLETFEALPSSWTRSGAGVLSIESGGVNGGSVLRATGVVALTFPQNIPFDAAKLLRLRVRVRRTVGTGRLYAGLQGMAANGTSFVRADGANVAGLHYVLAANPAISTTDWVVYEGWVRGAAAVGASTPSADPTAPRALHSSVRYIRPGVLLNELGTGTDVMEIDEIEIAVFDEDLSLRGYTGLDAAGALKTSVLDTAHVAGVPASRVAAPTAFFKNPTWSNWSAALPAGLNNYGTPDVTKVASLTRPSGSALRMNAAAVAAGVEIPNSGTGWDTGLAEQDYIVIEVAVILDSGTWQGAGILVDFMGTGGGYYRHALDFEDIMLGKPAGALVTFRCVLEREAGTVTGTYTAWAGIRAYLIANFTGFAAATAKVMRWDSFSVRAATEEEIKSHRTIQTAGRLRGDAMAILAGGSIAGTMMKQPYVGTMRHNTAVTFAGISYQDEYEVVALRTGGNQPASVWGTKAAVDAGTASGAPPTTHNAPEITFVKTPTGFTPKLYYVGRSAPAARAALFSLPTTGITVGNETGAATLLDADIPAVDDTYRVSGSLFLETTTKAWSGTVIISMVLDGTTVIGTRAIAFDLGTNDNSEIEFNLEGTYPIDGSGHSITVELTSRGSLPTGASEPYFDLSSNLGWNQDTGATYASMTPGATDVIGFIAFAKA